MEFGRAFWVGLVCGIALTAITFLVATRLSPQASDHGQGARRAAESTGENSKATSKADLDDITRQLKSWLAISVDGGNYDPGALAEDVARMMAAGYGRTQSVAAVKRFVDAARNRR